jgi:hypothetical protein
VLVKQVRRGKQQLPLSTAVARFVTELFTEQLRVFKSRCTSVVVLQSPANAKRMLELTTPIRWIEARERSNPSYSAKGWNDAVVASTGAQSRHCGIPVNSLTEPQTPSWQLFTHTAFNRSSDCSICIDIDRRRWVQVFCLRSHKLNLRFCSSNTRSPRFIVSYCSVQATTCS